MKYETFGLTTWDEVAEHPDRFDIAVIMRGVSDTDEEVSSTACRALRRRQNTQDARPHIGRLIRDRRWFVRTTAIALLPAISKPHALKHCISMALNDQDDVVCEAALDTALRLLAESEPHPGPQDRERPAETPLCRFLVKATRSGNPALRRLLADRLSWNKTLRGWLPYLIVAEKLANDPLEEIRQQVVEDLASWGVSEGLPRPAAERVLRLLRDATGDRARSVRKAAVAGLTHWCDSAQALDSIVKSLDDLDPEVCMLAAACLAAVGWAPNSDTQAVKLSVARGEFDGIERFGVEAIKMICGAGQFTPQSEAVMVKVGRPTVEVLMNWLEDNVGRAIPWEAAIRVLSAVASKGDVPRLLKLAYGGKLDGSTQFYVDKAVEQLQRPSVNELMEACRATDVKERREAALALGETAGDHAIEALLQLLGDPDEFVRVNAAMSLGRVGGPPVVKALERAVTSVGADVQTYFWNAIAAIKARHGDDK